MNPLDQGAGDLTLFLADATLYLASTVSRGGTGSCARAGRFLQQPEGQPVDPSELGQRLLGYPILRSQVMRIYRLPNGGTTTERKKYR